MRIASPVLPAYIPEVPVSLIGRGGLSPEDRETLLVLWGCAVEAVRRGCDPVWRRADLVRLLREALGLSASQAYQRLDRLLQLRLLRAGLAREWDPEAPARRGALIGLGEAFEADLARVRDPASPNFPADRNLPAGQNFPADRSSMPGEIPADRNFPADRIPTIKEEPCISGGGGENLHDWPHEKPPPPELEIPAGRNFPADRNFPPALQAMGWIIGIQAAAGMEAAARSGLGPRALWRLWAVFRDRGGRPGGLVRLLQELGPAARGRVPPDGPLPPADPCPRCGADVGKGGPGCPACGARLRECARCGELAPEEGPCPWCGEEPPAWAPPDPDFMARWRAACERVRERLDIPGLLAASLEGVLPVAVARDGRGWRVRVRAGPNGLRLLGRPEVARELEAIFGHPVAFEAAPPEPAEAPEGEGEEAFPEALRPLAEALAEAMSMGKLDPGIVRDLGAMLQAGVTPDHIRAAARMLRDRGQAPGSPSRLLALAWDLAARERSG